MSIKHILGSRGTRKHVYNMFSKLPVYEITYGDVLRVIIRGLISGIASEVNPVTKEIGMEAFNVVKERAGEQLGSSGLNLLKTKL